MKITMAYCTKCGEQAIGEGKFCTKCGNPIVERCKKCSYPIMGNSKFCARCGMPVTDLSPKLTYTVQSGFFSNPLSQIQPSQYTQSTPVTNTQNFSFQTSASALPSASNISSNKARYTPLTFIMYSVSFIYVLAAFFPTYEINIPFYDFGFERTISILDAVRMGDFGLDLKAVASFHTLCFLFFIVAIILNGFALLSVILHKDRTFWLLLALSGIVALIGLLIWVLEWGIVFALLKSNYITYLVAEIINPTPYLFLAIVSALFMIIFSFIRRHRSYNY